MSKAISCTCNKNLFTLYDMGGYVRAVCTGCSTEVVVSASVKIETLNSKKQVVPEKSNNINLTKEEMIQTGNMVQIKLKSWFANSNNLDLEMDVEIETVTEKAFSYILHDEMKWIPKSQVEEIEVLQTALDRSGGEKPKEGWGEVSEGDVPF